MIRPGVVLFLFFAACSADLGSGVAGRTGPSITTVPVETGPTAESVQRLVSPSRTTTSTVAWASVRLADEQLIEVAVPVRLAIDAIDIDARVLPLGVKSGTGQMEVPENVDEVGWYRYGSAPGWPGSAVFAAHVDMAGKGPGVFFHLDRLRMGDPIDVDFDDGTTLTFVVSHAERVPKGELDFDSIFSTSGEPLLRLVTCGGGFNRTSRSYEDNVVITANPLRP